ncbi:MAG: hypothetical protein FWE29_05030 [Defluviitaleaceae bacterium]|nr:hypothetical protein [Defluviitaleaceae bacterium]
MDEKCPVCGEQHPYKISHADDPHYMYHKCGKCGYEWRDKKSYLPILPY